MERRIVVVTWISGTVASYPQGHEWWRSFSKIALFTRHKNWAYLNSNPVTFGMCKLLHTDNDVAQNGLEDVFLSGRWQRQVYI